MTTTQSAPGAGSQPAVEEDEPAPPRGGKLRSLMENAADILQFSGQVFRTLPQVRLYLTEGFRQTGMIIISSGLVIWLMEFVIGAVFAVEGHYITRQFGAGGYVGVFPALGGLRTCAPEMWGWILSAKVGCGLVAEIGSMRITEEIDALEVMGIRPMPYLVGTRLIAAWIAMPFLYIVGLGLLYISSWFVIVHVLKTVSEGGYFDVFWAFQSPLDVLFSVIWTMILGTMVVIIGCYYGYNARGGPVGVGTNTARSMVVNMVLVSLIGLICQQIFWGGFPNAPIAN